MELICIKRIIKFFVLLGLILIGFILGILLSPNVSGNTDINFTFERDVLFNQNDTNFYQDFNTREFKIWEDTGEFNASFSFEGEVGKQGLDIAFIDIIESGEPEQITVIDELDEHKDVLLLNHSITIRHNHTSSEGHLYGFDEYWFRTTGGYSRVVFSLKDKDNNNLGLWRIYQGTIWEQFIGPWEDTTIAFSQDTWHHIRFEWEYTNGGFMGLAESRCNIRLDGVDSIHAIVDNDYYINQLSIKVDTVNDAYLDAYGEYWDIPYTGEHFDVSTQDAFSYGITYNNTNFITSGSQNDKIYEYYLNGTYTNNWFDSPGAFPKGIMWNETYIYIVDSGTDIVYKYTSNGIYTGDSFYVGGQELAPSGIAWDGNYFWITGISTDNVFKYYLNGTYTDEYFSTSTQDGAPAGIVWVDNYFWIAGYEKDAVYKYTSDGIYTGEFFNVSNQATQPTDITWDGEYFWIIDDDTQEVYKYSHKIYYYTLGDNLYSSQELSESGTEVNRWEFSHESLFERFEDGDDNPNGWSDLEDGEDDVNWREKDDFDGIIELYANSGDGIALYKDNIGYDTDIELNVSFGFEIKYFYSVLHNDVYMKIYSSDNTEIVRIRVYHSGELKYWTGSAYVQLDTGFVINTDYHINLNINYETDNCILRYSTNGTYTDSFEFPLTTSAKTGLKKVSFDAIADTDYCQVYLDYIGIYVNKRSITTDFGSIGLHISDHSYWYFNEYNLLTLNIIGDGISIYLDLADYVSTTPDFIHEVLVSAKDYTGLEIINMYDYLYDDYWGYNYIWGGVLWFHFYDTFEFNSTTLEGVKLTDGTNDYSLQFDHSGVNVMDNYFYVLDNKLYFSQTSNDTNLEYIQATFDIDNVNSGNYSVSYNSILEGNSLGEFRIGYTDDTSLPLPLRTYVSAPNVILAQDKIVAELIILITDNDNDAIQGTTTGYITEIKFNHVQDVSNLIIIFALLGVIIPLIIMIVPTFLIYERYGKSVILPVFLLMTFICFITSLIPAWLFFIVLMSGGSYLFIKKDEVKE